MRLKSDSSDVGEPNSSQLW